MFAYKLYQSPYNKQDSNIASKSFKKVPQDPLPGFKHQLVLHQLHFTLVLVELRTPSLNSQVPMTNTNYLKRSPQNY